MNICFLDYLSRSGSTLLAQKLSRYEEIAVSQEADFPDGIIRGQGVIRSGKELDDYIRRLNKDWKFRAWRIDNNYLKNRLREYSYPIFFDTILRECLKASLPRNDIRIFIYKSNLYFLYFQEVLGLFPGAKFIFIDRDPRAIFNSQKKMKSLVDKKLAWGDITRFLVLYQRAQKQLRELEQRDCFFCLRFEDLVMNEELQIRQLLEFLSAGHAKQDRPADYYARIPDASKPLHKNVRADNLPSRVQAWQKELSDREICFLQTRLYHEMRYNGYLPYQGVSCSSLARLPFLFWELKLFFESARSLGLRRKAIKQWRRFLRRLGHIRSARI